MYCKNTSYKSTGFMLTIELSPSPLFRLGVDIANELIKIALSNNSIKKIKKHEEVNKN